MILSVIIPFYNLERYVRSCLDSVLAAAKRIDGAEVEVICVDDGSTDGTAVALDSFLVPDALSFVLRVIHRANGGEGSARNAGIAVASGDWLTFLDGDDVWTENHLETAVPVLNGFADADIVSFRHQEFDDGSVFHPVVSADPVVTEYDTSESIDGELLLRVGVYPTFFRRDFVAGARFSSLPLGADRLFVAERLSCARKVVMSTAVIYGYRIRTGSMAHLAWNGRKVTSQCDYAFGSLKALVASEKKLGRKGYAYLASLWLSDVPNRLTRLRGDERRIAWRHWRDTLDAADVVRGYSRFEFVRRLLLSVGWNMRGSLLVARILRKGGIS